MFAYPGWDMQSIPSTSLQMASVAELRARPGRKWHDYPDDVLPAWIAETDQPLTSGGAGLDPERERSLLDAWRSKR